MRIFSVANLHAKVYVLGTTALIGSANASQHSAHTLVEAMLLTTDRKVVEKFDPVGVLLIDGGVEVRPAILLPASCSAQSRSDQLLFRREPVVSRWGGR